MDAPYDHSCTSSLRFTDYAVTRPAIPGVDPHAYNVTLTNSLSLKCRNRFIDHNWVTHQFCGSCTSNHIKPPGGDEGEAEGCIRGVYYEDLGHKLSPFFSMRSAKN